jgi:hypothetical protein
MVRSARDTSPRVSSITRTCFFCSSTSFSIVGPADGSPAFSFRRKNPSSRSIAVARSAASAAAFCVAATSLNRMRSRSYVATSCWSNGRTARTSPVATRSSTAALICACAPGSGVRAAAFSNRSSVAANGSWADAAAVMRRRSAIGRMALIIHRPSRGRRKTDPLALRPKKSAAEEASCAPAAALEEQPLG